MTLFWTLAAAMILLGMGWIIPPLVRPKPRSVSEREQQNIAIARERLRLLEDEFASGAMDPEQFEHSRLEIEQILANDLGSDSDNAVASKTAQYGLKTAFVVILSFPLLSILLYGLLGNIEGLSVEPRVAASPEHPGNAAGTPSVQDMVNRLAERLKEDPDNPEGWRLLARSYSVMERYPEAIEALRRARGLVGDDPNLLIELADMMATAQNGSFEGQPAELVAKVLEMSPEHPGGLWLAGRSAVMVRDFPLALSYWRQLETVLPKDGEGLDTVRLAIAKVEKEMGRGGVIAQPVAETLVETEPETAAPTGPAITVKVNLDQSLSTSVDPDDAVFIYAQALNGPPMPLAVTRKQVRDLPLQVTLNDSMAMMPAMALSKFSQVRVIARVSKTGNAIPQSGDFKGQVEPVSVTQSAPIEIVIADKIP
ncbi:MAG: c-type cytochrome biogenesis protein CcmI [Methylococcales bacterium]